jgi:hypothetical protein
MGSAKLGKVTLEASLDYLGWECPRLASETMAGMKSNGCRPAGPPTASECAGGNGPLVMLR